VIKKNGWLRPRLRLYPARPKIGLRASHINEYWHVDATIMRLSDGTKAYLQVVSDNFSKLALAWSASLEINGVNTKKLIHAAMDRATELCGATGKPTQIADSGSENVNSEVYGMKKKKLIDIEIALIDIDESNSAAEVIFRMAKHNYLFFQELNNFNAFKRHCDIYLKEYSEVIAHSALKGATPMEAYLSKWGESERMTIAEQTEVAKQSRKERNIASSCKTCLF